MTPEEIEAFVSSGQSALTLFAQAQEMLEKWGASFESRGGGEVYGATATEIAYINNDLKTYVADPAKAATISRLRNDV